MLRRQLGDLSCLAPTGVVFPQPALGVEVFLPLAIQPKGTLRASTGIGLEPVVSTPTPITWVASKPRVFFAAASAARTLASSPKR